MGYIRNNLAPSERVVYETKLHWKIFILPVLALGLAGWLYSQDWVWLSRIFAVSGGLSLLAMLIKYFTNEFVITTNNLRFRQGLFPETDRIPLDKITRVKLKSRYNPIDMVLDSGNMIVFTDSNEKIEFRNIFSPAEFDKRANQQLNNSQPENHAKQTNFTQTEEKEFWRKLETPVGRSAPPTPHLYAAHTKKWILTPLAHRAFHHSTRIRTSQES